MRLFHGTRAPVVVGDLLLPPTVTGVRSAATLGFDSHGYHRPDQVYATSIFGEACSYAITELLPHNPRGPIRAFAGPGLVFEVEAIGPTELDEETIGWRLEGAYLRFARAVIIRAFEVPPDLVKRRSVGYLSYDDYAAVQAS